MSATKSAIISETFLPETDRLNRTYNVAIAVLQIHMEHHESRSVSCRSVRSYIRKKLNLPVIEGREMDGDYRAHGDSVGGHGLHLETIKINKQKCIKLNDENIEKCEQYIGRRGTADMSKKNSDLALELY